MGRRGDRRPAFACQRSVDRWRVYRAARRVFSAIGRRQTVDTLADRCCLFDATGGSCTDALFWTASTVAHGIITGSRPGSISGVAMSGRLWPPLEAPCQTPPPKVDI